MGVRLPLDATSGERPRALELERDSFDIFNDDAVSLKFDVRRDQRTTVGFVVNSAGTQLDYVALENGSAFRREFDAIWVAATSVTADAWYAEFKLPAAALGVPDAKGAIEMGMNVTRDHSSRAAVYDWSHIPPEFGATSALYYGTLHSIEGLGGGRPLTFIPYLLGRYASEAPGDISLGEGASLDGEVGGDVRLRLLEDLWAELTILPDFAQVDLDDPVVNFDRFPLFFPERRPFFLTGLEVFEFGRPRVVQLFFSRRIGLDDDGNPIPVDAGFKMYGSQGSWRVGAFQVMTRAPAAQDAASSFSVLRLRRNFSENGHLGVISTVRGDVGWFSGDSVPFEPDLSVGADGSLRILDRRFIVDGFWAYTRNTSPNDGAAQVEDGMSARLGWAYLGEQLQPSLSVLLVERDFDPEVGFVRRQGIIRANGGLVFLRRPKPDQNLKLQINLSGETIRSTERDENLGQSAEVFGQLVWRSGWNGSSSFRYVEDVVEESFTLLGRRTVDPGRYRGVAGSLFINSPSVRNPTLNLGYQYDTAFFGGTRHGPSIGAGWSLGPHVETSLAAGLSFSRFPDGFSEDAFTLNTRLAVSPSTRLTVDAIVQHNTVASLWTGLGRLRWRYLPGSDLFLVGRYELETGTLASDQFDLTLKIQFRYDLLL